MHAHIKTFDSNASGIVSGRQLLGQKTHTKIPYILDILDKGILPDGHVLNEAFIMIFIK